MAGGCPTCGTENPPQARFCMGCGGALARACASCGAELPAQARFCMSCGTAVGDAAGPAPPAAGPALSPPGTDGAGLQRGPAPPSVPESPPEERRQVTVLFADLSGYTAMSERMDPEDVKGLVEQCLRRLADEVDHHGGTVDKFIGDNVMALFGAPVAHEDDPLRAVRAGLAMQAAMGELNRTIAADYGVELALRVGVNTGEVLAGAVGDSYTVVGDSVNVASRLQAAGSPGAVVVGERTFRSTADEIEYRALTPLELKGKADAVLAWEATGERPAKPGGAGREAPLIGRDAELELLASLHQRVVGEGRPHLVTVMGEAGVGKSRLSRELTARLGDDARVLQGRCPAYGSSLAFWALGEIVRGDCGILDEDAAELAWEKLRTRIGGLLGDDSDADGPSALIGRLLGIETPGAPPGDEFEEDGQHLRDAFFSAIRSWIEALARERPLVLIFEDLHWADEGLLDLVDFLAGWARAPVLLLCLSRADLLERRPDWGGGRRRATSLFLEPLGDEDARRLVGELLAGSGARGIVDAVAERSGGNPFFVEEMVRRVSEDAGDADQLPDNVQALLAARLDALPAVERRVVQHAAVVGRTFWPGVLERLAGTSADDLDAALEGLQEKDIFVPGEGSGLAGEPELAFRHVLIRDVAYGMLPKAVRARRHFAVGAHLEERAGDRGDEVVALLAEHYGRAATLAAEARMDADELKRIRATALPVLEAAGDAAAALYSNQEAFAHYEAARRISEGPLTLARVLEKQGDVATRMGRLDQAIQAWEACLERKQSDGDREGVARLQRKLGAALADKGERRAAVERYQAGINLLKDGAPTLELVRLYEEAAWLYANAGDNMLAIYAAEKALRHAEALGEARAASRAHGIFGRVFGRLGDNAKARQNLERSVELARGSDPRETALALLALGEHLEVGEGDEAGARRAYEQALALAQEVGQVTAQVEVHAALARLAISGADWEEAARHGETSQALADREGLTGKLALPLTLRAFEHWRAGDLEGAEARYSRAYELADRVGWSEVAVNALYGLGATRRDRGDTTGAADAFARAMDVCDRAGLAGQGVLMTAARAVALALSGDPEAGAVAARAQELASRLPYPAAMAAATEAVGATLAPEEGAARLAEAQQRWLEIGRPLDAARCGLLRGQALQAAGDPAAGAALADTAAEYERLGISHRAESTRSLASRATERA